jgi:hypothetical protein
MFWVILKFDKGGKETNCMSNDLLKSYLNILYTFLCGVFFCAMKKKLQEVIEREEREGRSVNREETSEERRQWQQFQERMDIEDRDIIIQGSNTTRLSRKQVKFNLTE